MGQKLGEIRRIKMQILKRDEVKQKMGQKAENIHLIEVLDKKNFEESHLPEAVNIPLSSSDFEAQIKKAVPNKSDEVIVYCQNQGCSASEDAAKKIEALGYTNVNDYAAGKEDWKSAGYPMH